jgi:superoxide reductase
MMNFFICKHCGNIAVKATDKGPSLSCCGEVMQELTANTTDAAKEKHVPVISVSGSAVEVQVGSAAHPMLEEHFINWIVLETSKGGHRAVLSPGAEPKASFCLPEGEKPVAVYEYCNLHGLWKTDC